MDVLWVSTATDSTAPAGAVANGIREAGVVEFEGIVLRTVLRRTQRRGREFASVFALGTASASSKRASKRAS
jgi:hypothetical protein